MTARRMLTEAAIGRAFSRTKARLRVDQRLPVYPPFGASWQMAARPCDTFPLTPLKFRTAGFPQYGFKPESIRRHLHRLRRLIGDLKRRRPPDLVIPALSRGQGRDRRCVPVQRPLARRRVVLSRRVVAYYGLIRASGPAPGGL